MSDERLRQLERQYLASGSPEDEAAWLHARLQAGELSEDQQELLAYLDCRVAAPRAYQATPTRTPHELGGWVHGLPHYEGARHYPWAIEIYWRVGVALARAISDEEVTAILEAGDQLRLGLRRHQPEAVACQVPRHEWRSA